MYAKVMSDNQLKYAQHYVIKEDKLVLNPQEQNYLDAGYKPVIDMPMPLSETGQEYVQKIIEEENQIIITYSPVENEATQEDLNNTTTS